MLNKIKVSTIPLRNGECAVEIVITIGTEQPKKVTEESPIYAETLEALAETWMDKDKRNYGNDEDEGFLYDNLD